MATKKSDPKDKRKFTITADVKKGTVKVAFDPKDTVGVKNVGEYLNVIMAGLELGLKELLYYTGRIRPPTKLEEENNLYVFYQPEEDNKRYNSRKYIYKSIAQSFNMTLKELFPDITYIDETTKARQEAVLNMTAEEAREYLAKIEGITDKVIEELDYIYSFEECPDDEEE